MRCVWLAVCAALLLVMFTGNATASLRSSCRRMKLQRCYGLGGGWYSLDSKRCFKLYGYLRTFSQAKKICERGCGEMLSLHNVHQYNKVLCRLYKYYHRRRLPVWIGGMRASRRAFRWSDGTKWNFSRWNRGEPNNYGGRESCVEMNFGRWGRWNDRNCRARRRFVCTSKCSD